MQSDSDNDRFITLIDVEWAFQGAPNSSFQHHRSFAKKWLHFHHFCPQFSRATPFSPQRSGEDFKGEAPLLGKYTYYIMHTAVSKVLLKCCEIWHLTSLLQVELCWVGLGTYPILAKFSQFVGQDQEIQVLHLVGFLSCILMGSTDKSMSSWLLFVKPYGSWSPQVWTRSAVSMWITVFIEIVRAKWSLFSFSRNRFEQ